MLTHTAKMNNAFNRLCKRFGYKPWTSNDLTVREVYQVVTRAAKFRRHYAKLLLRPQIKDTAEYLDEIEDVCGIAPCPGRFSCPKCDPTIHKGVA